MKKISNYKKNFSQIKKTDQSLIITTAIFIAFSILAFISSSSMSISIFGSSIPTMFASFILSVIALFFIHEKFGKNQSKMMAYSSLLILVGLALLNILPLQNSMAFLNHNSLIANLIIAIIYFVSIFIGIILYNFIRYKTKYKYLWARSVISLLISFTLFLILFIGTTKILDTDAILMKNNILFSYIFAIFSIILLYIFVTLFGKKPFNKNYQNRSKNGKSFTNDAKNSNSPKKYGENARRNQKPRVYK